MIYRNRKKEDVPKENIRKNKYKSEKIVEKHEIRQNARKKQISQYKFRIYSSSLLTNGGDMCYNSTTNNRSQIKRSA